MYSHTDFPVHLFSIQESAKFRKKFLDHFQLDVELHLPPAYSGRFTNNETLHKALTILKQRNVAIILGFFDGHDAALVLCMVTIICTKLMSQFYKSILTSFFCRPVTWASPVQTMCGFCPHTLTPTGGNTLTATVWMRKWETLYNQSSLLGQQSTLPSTAARYTTMPSQLSKHATQLQV